MYIEIVLLTAVTFLTMALYGFGTGLFVGFFFLCFMIGMHGLIVFLDIIRDRDPFEEILQEHKRQLRERGGLR